MRQIFFLTLPLTMILTAMFLDWLGSALWRRFRGRKNTGGGHADATRPPDEDSRSKAQAG
jgi:hypothetical protein